MAGNLISMSNGKLNVPNNPIIPFIEGDGTGRDIWRASVRVFDAAVAKVYGGKRKIAWMEVYAGEKAFNKFKTGTPEGDAKAWLPDDTVEAFKAFLVGIKGPLTTPVGGGIRSLNVALRQLLDLYVCLRPVQYFAGVPSPVKHPEKVNRLVVLAPAYNRGGALDAPASPPPTPNGAMSSQSHDEFIANWDRQVGCADQYDRNVANSVWSEMLASDPVGATWGSGVRRAPQVPTWGFNQAVVSAMKTPFLMVSGAHDKQVAPEHVRELYEDLGARDKVFIDLACSSHNAMWEKNHTLLFEASREWLERGTVGGASIGMVRRGY